MVKVRLSQDDDAPKRPKSRTKVRKAKVEEKPDPKEEPVIVEEEDEPEKPAPPKEGVHVRPWRGMSERQWFISLLVASGLLLLITFRGCILPSGVGPKTEDSQSTKQRTEQAEPKSTEKPADNEYTVQAGDTLGKIAARFDTTAQAIAEANDIQVTTTLRVGQKLQIP